jgi:type II secretory pathway predicted ATPase ExeA
MYESHWNLHCRPFESGADPRLFYPNEAHQGALLKLRYAIEGRRGAALLVGEPGVGKTLLVRLLDQHLPESIQPRGVVLYPQLPVAELIASAADALDCPPADGGTLELQVRRIQRHLLDRARQGQHTLLVVDEAHLIEAPRGFEALRLLLNFEHEGSPALTLLLVGHATLVPLLERLPQFDGRLAVKCVLRPLTADETFAYVHHRLHAAGAEQPVFTSEAVQCLHELTRGNPRAINRLCDLALLLGFAEDHRSLSAEHVAAAAGELHLLGAA